MVDNPGKRRPRILVVEDDYDLRHMLVRILATVADVAEAEDGELAMEVLTSSSPPDLVVTDVMMPHKDGLQLVAEMKRDPQLAKVPAIILTAKAQPKDVILGINAGARHYLTKPFKSEELLSRVKKVLRL